MIINLEVKVIVIKDYEPVKIYLLDLVNKIDKKVLIQ